MPLLVFVVLVITLVLRYLQSRSLHGLLVPSPLAVELVEEHEEVLLLFLDLLSLLLRLRQFCLYTRKLFPQCLDLCGMVSALYVIEGSQSVRRSSPRRSVTPAR